MRPATVFHTCQPRTEILQGDLREELFAARPRDVVEGRVDPVYQDPSRFFENTYLTDGLKALLGEVYPSGGGGAGPAAAGLLPGPGGDEGAGGPAEDGADAAVKRTRTDADRSGFQIQEVFQ